MYSPDRWEVLAEINSVSCITIIALLFGRKVASIDGPINYIQILLLLLYSLCWAFNLVACMLTSTNNGNYISCLITNFNWALTNTAAKCIIYLHFIEKIHIISIPKSPRFKTPLYLANLALLLPSLAIMMIQLIYKEDNVQDESPYHCYVGFGIIAYSVAFFYDTLLSLLYIGIFLKFYCFPNTVQQTAYQSSSFRLMSKRNSVAAVITLLTSIGTFAVQVALNGRQRGLVLSSTGTISLTIVCVAIHWVTTHPAEVQLNEKALQRVNGDKPVRLEIKQHQEVVILTELNNRS